MTSYITVDAITVSNSAVKKREELKESISIAKEEWFAKRRSTPIKVGHLWWRQTRLPTEEEVVYKWKGYDLGGFDYSPEYWVEKRFNYTLSFYEGFIRMADTARTNSDSEKTFYLSPEDHKALFHDLN